jgi:hypothetical protein
MSLSRDSLYRRRTKGQTIHLVYWLIFIPQIDHESAQLLQGDRINWHITVKPY